MHESWLSLKSQHFAGFRLNLCSIVYILFRGLDDAKIIVIIVGNQLQIENMSNNILKHG